MATGKEKRLTGKMHRDRAEYAKYHGRNEAAAAREITVFNAETEEEFDWAKAHEWLDSLGVAKTSVDGGGLSLVGRMHALLGCRPVSAEQDLQDALDGKQLRFFWGVVTAPCRRCGKPKSEHAPLVTMQQVVCPMNDLK